MNLQVLVSTMNQTDYSLLEKMNIQSDAIVINQCDKNDYAEFDFKGHKIKWYSFNERGVGLSRNTALQRAEADVILFADDDITYADGYAETVINFFKTHKKVALATFNFESLNSERPEHIDTVNHKLHNFNCLKYGAAKIAARRQAVIGSGITFSLLFGGGAKFQAGEDNLFITQCINRHLKAEASADIIGTVKQDGSTWFKGYNEKYYTDRGALFRAMYGKMAVIILTLFELKNFRRKSDFGTLQRLKFGFAGIKEFDNYKY